MTTPAITVGQKLGHFRLVEKIGGGGQGLVFRAHDERFDKDVALKILPPMVLADEGARRRFRREAHAVGKLIHPNIATAFYFGEENGIDFLVTEYVSGSGLDEKVAQGPMAEEAVVALGIQLASGLEAAHHEGIIHRDLKPGNLRITQEGHLKILDFGLAELLEPAGDLASAETVTINMTLTGTLQYMAPEQFRGVCDQRTDLWSAGAVLYEMATGQLPFPETQVQKLKEAILKKNPTRPNKINPNLSKGLESVILRALQKDPKKRYQTATDLKDDLVGVARGRTVKHDSLRYRKDIRTAAAMVLAAVLGFATYHFWPRHPKANQLLGFRVLAVLPLESGSEGGEENALVRGVADTISARIAQSTNAHTFQLIPPSELSAKGVKTAEAATREFGVDRVLSVALQRAPDKMRVTCSLINPKTHQQMDARTLTGDANDLFALEDSAVTDVFAMLPPNTRSEQLKPSEVHAAAPAAYEYYVRGRGYLLEYQKPENIDAAIREFEQALHASPNYARAYAGLGEAYWQGYEANRGKEWLNKAKANCEKALYADPKLAEGHICLGNLFNETGRYNEAVEQFQQALAAEHDNADSLSGLAGAYKHMGNAAAAEDTYKKAIVLRPQYWAVYNRLGIFYYGEARYADAAAEFRKVVELTPDNTHGYYNLGAMYILEGKYDDAIAASDRSIKLQPTMSAYSNLGTAYFYQHRYPDAVTAFERARSLDDQDYLNWGNLGDALYWSSNRRPESVAAYKRAIELGQSRLQDNPKDATTRAFVASYDAMIGDRHAATVELEKALKQAPRDPDVLFRSALVYNQLGDRNRTLDSLQKAVAAKFSRTTVRDTPDFDHLKSNPAFAAIIAKA
jgi:serine/threonine protein kinase/Tfp pilus assembly protein PilF